MRGGGGGGGVIMKRQNDGNFSKIVWRRALIHMACAVNCIVQSTGADAGFWRGGGGGGSDMNN